LVVEVVPPPPAAVVVVDAAAVVVVVPDPASSFDELQASPRAARGTSRRRADRRMGRG
jgi:hypothetical protein